MDYAEAAKVLEDWFDQFTQFSIYIEQEGYDPGTDTELTHAKDALAIVLDLAWRYIESGR